MRILLIFQLYIASYFIISLRTSSLGFFNIIICKCQERTCFCRFWFLIFFSWSFACFEPRCSSSKDTIRYRLKSYSFEINDIRSILFKTFLLILANTIFETAYVICLRRFLFQLGVCRYARGIVQRGNSSNRGRCVFAASICRDCARRKNCLFQFARCRRLYKIWSSGFHG